MKHKLQLGKKVGALATALLCALALTACKQSAPQMQQQVPQVKTISIEKGSLLLTDELPGRTSAYRVAEIRPQVNGLILKRLFEEGSDVKAGQSLYQIDPAPFEASLNNAKAALARAEANLPAIQLRAERYKQALENKAVSQQDFDDASASLKQAVADIAFYKASVDTAEINLNYAKVLSPLNGRIGTSSVTDGATVTAYQQVPLAVVQQLDPIYVDVPQSTTEMMSLRKRLQDGLLISEGDVVSQVELILDDGSTYSQTGTLQFRDVSVDPTTSTVTLRMVFPNPKNELLPGMFVRAIVKEGVDNHALLVPQEAVGRDRKGRPYVMIVKDGKSYQHLIELDRAAGNKWLVSSGLDGSEHIIIEGLQNIRHETPVQEVYAGVYGKETAPAPVAAQPAAAAAPAAAPAPAEEAAPQK